MGSAGNQNSWTPYDYKDCSLGICSIYCPQFCYFIFPPPPPPLDDDDSASPFSPLIIAIIGVLASAFILVSYYTIVTRFCSRNGAVEADGGGVARDQWQQTEATGLEEAAIKAITVCRYRKGEGLIEGSECAVCLSEFEENEGLRLLPKCSHAFHLPCIDTWLKSHSNCPLCRATVVSPQPSSPPPQRPRDLIVVVVDEQQLHYTGGGGGGAMPKSPNAETRNQSGVSHLKRSVSLGTLPSERHVLVEVGGFGEDLARKRCESWREIGSSNGISERRHGSGDHLSVIVDRDKGKNTVFTD